MIKRVLDGCMGAMVLVFILLATAWYYGHVCINYKPAPATAYEGHS